MSDPLVSVIVPAYNAEPTLRAALDSVAAQTYARLELLVVDDHSDDGTATLAAETLRYHAITGRILSRTPGLRRSAGAARNEGVAIAQGEILAFLDSDDIWFPEHLQRAVNQFLAHGSQMVAYVAPGMLFDEAGDRGLIPAGGFPVNGITPIRNLLFDGMQMTNASLCVTKESFQTSGGYHDDLRCYEDWWLFLHLSCLGYFFIDDQPGCRIRVKAESLSRTTNAGRSLMSRSMHEDGFRLCDAVLSDDAFTPTERLQLQSRMARCARGQLVDMVRLRCGREALSIVRSCLRSRTGTRSCPGVCVGALCDIAKACGKSIARHCASGPA